MRLILAGGLDPDNVADAVQGRRAVGRRRVDRRRGVAGPQGPAEGQALHRARPRRRARAATSAATSCPTTGSSDEWPIDEQRDASRELMAEPTGTRALRRVRRSLRARDARAGVRGARGGVPRGVGRPGVPRRARRRSCATTPAARRSSPSATTSAPSSGMRLLLKREDLNHTGSHKINNVLGQALLAKRMGKTAARRRDRRRPARRRHGHRGGAAGHGVQGVHGRGRRRAPGAQRVPHAAARRRGRGRATAAAARSRTPSTRRCATGWPRSSTRHYCLGSVMGPHPYPWMVREFHRVIGDEAREQCRALTGRRPRRGRRLRRRRLERHRALLRLRRHRRPAGRRRARRRRRRRPRRARRRARHAQLPDAGRVRPGARRRSRSPPASTTRASGPSTPTSRSIGRAEYPAVTDAEVIDAFQLLARTEGIIPALESAHAAGLGRPRGRRRCRAQTVLINLSGRGDKDVAQMMDDRSAR